jgi:hypothetical protein
MASERTISIKKPPSAKLQATHPAVFSFWGGESCDSADQRLRLCAVARLPI